MLRMYFVQQWYGLADEAVEDAVYDSAALGNFMGIDRSRTGVPDATTLMGFRHLLEAHDLTKAMLVEVNIMLMERGLVRGWPRETPIYSVVSQFDLQQRYIYCFGVFVPRFLVIA